MEITVEYTGQLAGIVGEAEEKIELSDDATLGALIAKLCEQHGEDYAGLIAKAEGDLHPSTLIIFDGEQTDPDVHASLKGVKTVMLMTPIAGG